MSVILFLIVTIAIYSIPIPFNRDMFEFRRLFKWLPFRLLWATGTWFMICILMMEVLPWAVLSLVTSYGLLLLISGGSKPRDIEEFVNRMRAPMLCIGLIILIMVPILSGIISWTSDVANAESFDTFVTTTDDPLFSSPIPDNMVRLVTNEYAQFVARSHLSSIGSNVEIAAAHITTRNGRLVWVCVVVSTNVLSENFIKALIVVDANDPTKVEVIDDIQIPVGEGLFWDKNIQFGNYLEDMTNAYEYAYPTWDPAGNLVYVQTRTKLLWNFVEEPIGPKIYCQNGTIREYATIEDTPDWVTQAYSEEWLERQVNRWGGYRRDGGFDLFAGGFLWVIPPSNDRLIMTEDTRYIINPDSNRVEAMIAVHPPGASSLTLSGMIRATKNGVYYHDLSSRSLASGEAAINQVIKEYPNPVEGDYFGAMPLLYPVNINSTYSRLAWYCPIYWWKTSYDSESDEYYVSDIRLYALGIADAQDVTINAAIQAQGSFVGEQLVKSTRLAFIDEVKTALGVKGEEQTGQIHLNATIVNKTSYVSGGNTHIVLRTDNSTYEWIEGAEDWMSVNDWYELLTASVGDRFNATIRLVDDVYRIIAFSIE